MRGMAALTVVLWHFFCSTYTLPGVGIIYLVSRGDGAVVLFFILSGFVLSLPFQREQAPSYLTFVIRRICRIYLPYLAGIGLSILAITFVATSKIPQLSGWFNQTCGVPFNRQIALEHLCLIGNIHTNTYNNAIWSLVQEMRVSLVFPLLFWLVRRNKVITNLVLCGVLSGASALATRYQIETSNGYQTDYCFTLHVSSLFIIGILLAQYRESLSMHYRGISTAAKYAILFFALVLYRVSMESQAVLLRDYGAATGAAVFIVFALASGRISTLLRKPTFTFLGNISYAMYLNHLTILVLVMFLGYRFLSLWPLCLVIVASILAFSFPFWRWIERPSISLGRLLVRRIGIAPTSAKRAKVLKV